MITLNERNEVKMIAKEVAYFFAIIRWYDKY